MKLSTKWVSKMLAEKGIEVSTIAPKVLGAYSRLLELRGLQGYVDSELTKAQVEADMLVSKKVPAFMAELRDIRVDMKNDTTVVETK